jgi:hypothetical protein
MYRYTSICQELSPHEPRIREAPPGTLPGAVGRSVDSRARRACPNGAASRRVTSPVSAFAEPALPAWLLRVMTLACQALTDTLRQDILRFARFGRTRSALIPIGTMRVVGCGSFDVCHDGTAGPASAFSVGAAGAGTGVGLRGVTSRTSLVWRGSNGPCLRDCSMRLLT